MNTLTEYELDLEEKMFASLLKSYCNSQGEETDLANSCTVFMCLGVIYHTKFVRNFDLITARFDALRSAALYQAAFERSESCFKQEHDKLLSLYSAIFSAIRVPDYSTVMESIIATAHQGLEDMRAAVREEFRKIINPFRDEQQVNQLLRIKFYNSVESYQKLVTKRFIKLMRKIFEKCSSILGEPPCSFALLGLGSLARREVTPYSDFESILVLQNKVEVDETMMNYFRNYAMLAQLVVIGLGETILPAMSVKSLNDFETGGGDWFVDVVTKRGLSFDGLLPHACKNPLGRLPTAKKPWHTELIQTVDDMLSFVDEEMDLKEGYHLADIISHSVFVAGGDKEGQPTGKEVAAHFHELVRKKIVLKKRSQNTMCKLFATLQEDIAKYSFENQKHGQAVHVKKDLYRGITILLPQLAMLVGIRGKSSYDIIEGLNEEKLIDIDFCIDLKTAVAIANYARANTYFKKEAQSEVLAGGKSYPELKGTDIFENVSISALQVLYSVGAEFQTSLTMSFQNNHQITPLKRTTKPLSVGNVLFRFEQYDQAIKWFEKILGNNSNSEKKNNPSQISYNHLMLGRCYYSKNQHEVACHHFMKAEQTCQEGKSFERGRILLFRALSERKLKGVNTTQSLMKEAYDCFQKSMPTSSDPYDIESFQRALQALCGDNSDLVPELIEVIVITGDHLLQESKAPFPALLQYQNALVEMEKYYKDGRHILLSLYVKEKVAVCKGELGHFISAAQTWIEFAEQSKTMPSGAAADISFRQGYDPVDALFENASVIEKTFSNIESYGVAVNLCNRLVMTLNNWCNDHSSHVKLRRTKAKMNILIGELYERSLKYDLAIHHYQVSKSIYIDLYPNSHQAVDDRLIRCLTKADFHVEAMQLLRNFTGENYTLFLNVLNSSLHSLYASFSENLFVEIAKTIEVILDFSEDFQKHAGELINVLVILVKSLTIANATKIFKILANSAVLLLPQTVHHFVFLVEKATDMACKTTGVKQFSSLLIPSVVVMTKNFPKLAFNVQTSSMIRTFLNKAEIIKTKEEAFFLTVAAFNRFQKIDDLVIALEMLKPLHVVNKTTLLMRLAAADCLKNCGDFSNAISAYRLTLNMLTDVSTISTNEKNVVLADVMLGITSACIQQNQPDIAVKYLENVIQYIEYLLKDGSTKQYSTRLFSIAQEPNLRNSHHIFLEYRKLLLNGDSYPLLRPTNLSQLHTLLLFTYPPPDGLTKVYRLLEILLNASESCELANCSNSLVSRTDVVSLLMKRIFAIPTEIPCEVDLAPLVDARYVCADELVGFANVPPIREVIKFLAKLSNSLSWNQVVESALNSANLYTKNDRTKDAEQCLCACKDILKLAGEKHDGNEILWYKAKCSVELSFCRRKLGKTDKAWTHLTSAMKVSLPLAVDISHHQILTQRALEREPRSVAQWYEAVTYMTDLLASCNIYMIDRIVWC